MKTLNICSYFHRQHHILGIIWDSLLGFIYFCLQLFTLPFPISFVRKIKYDIRVDHIHFILDTICMGTKGHSKERKVSINEFQNNTK